MKKVMIITVGTGRYREDIAGAICYSINEQHPDKLIFLVTEKSENETLPIILGKVGDLEHEVITTHNFNDVEKLYLEYSDIISSLKDGTEKPEYLCSDYTSGTKAMSAAIILASVVERLDSIIYIYGERDEEGRVLPGTERSLSLTPRDIYYREGIRRFKDSFNIYQFKGCLEILDDFKEIGGKDKVYEISFLRDLALGYDHWDKFRLDKAIEHLGAASKNSELSKKYTIKGLLDRNNRFIHLERKSSYSFERLLDLIENSKRRAREGKYDDAVARLYRAIEYMTQIRLKDKFDIETSNIIGDALPEDIREKYPQDKLDRGIGLRASSEILRDLGDDMGRIVFDDLEKAKKGEKSRLKVILGKRNNSILAHGFAPVSKKDYDEFYSIIMDYLHRFFPELKNGTKEAEFPRI